MKSVLKLFHFYGRDIEVTLFLHIGYVRYNLLLLLYHFQEVPLDHSRLVEEEMLVCVAHFEKELFCSFGTPFLLRIKDVSASIVGDI